MVLIPYGGLANRMRVVASILAFKKDHQVNVKVYWVRNNETMCKFSDLFQSIDVPGFQVIDTDFKPLRYAKFQSKKVFKKQVCNCIGIFQDLTLDLKLFDTQVITYFKDWDNVVKISSLNKVVIETCYAFYSNHNTYHYFKPIDRLADRIKNETSLFNKNTVGVHIRRTDLNRTVESPTTAFVKAMNEQIEENSNTVFFLASDSEDEKRVLKNRFPTRIITSTKVVTRLSKTGMEDALVDLYNLAKTRLILGTSDSSFSVIAHYMGNIPHKVVKQ